MSAQETPRHELKKEVQLLLGDQMVEVELDDEHISLAVKMAIEKAGDRAAGSVLASDAFFPMPDNIEVAAKAKIAAIIEPGGSKKDPDVIAAADECKIAMVFSGMRNFRH